MSNVLNGFRARLLLRTGRREVGAILSWVLILVDVPRLVVSTETARKQESVDEIQEKLYDVYTQLNVALVELLKIKMLDSTKRDVDNEFAKKLSGQEGGW